MRIVTPDDATEIHSGEVRTLHAFRIALGHKPLFGSALVEDEANA